MSIAADNTRKTLIQRLMSSWTAKDEGGFTSAMADVAALGDGGSSPVAVHIHNGKVRDDDEPDDKKKDDEDEKKKTEDSAAALKPVMDAIAALGARLAKIEGKAKDADEPPDDKDKKKDDEDEEGTKDSVALADSWTDAISGAEIILPGSKPGSTFDASAPAKKTRMALCDFRRSVLAKAAIDSERGKPIRAALGARKTPIEKMTCDAISGVFALAVEHARSKNNGDADPFMDRTKIAALGDKGGPSAADLEKQNAKRWKREATA